MNDFEWRSQPSEIAKTIRRSALILRPLKQPPSAANQSVQKVKQQPVKRKSTTS